MNQITMTNFDNSTIETAEAAIVPATDLPTITVTAKETGQQVQSYQHPALTHYFERCHPALQATFEAQFDELFAVLRYDHNGIDKGMESECFEWNMEAAVELINGLWLAGFIQIDMTAEGWQERFKAMVAFVARTLNYHMW